MMRIFKGKSSNQSCAKSNGSIAVLTAFIAIGTAIISSDRSAYADNPHADVLSIGGSVTEIIYALGQEHRLIARDTTSTFPPEALKLPNVGYIRALSPEGVLSVNPDLILSEEGAGPPEALGVLKAAAIPFIEVPDGYDADTVAAKIKAVGTALDVQDEADALARDIHDRIDAAVARAEARSTAPKRVMFVLSTQGGRIMAAGRDTSASAIIELAGGLNALESIQGYKPISDEAIGLAAPDVIVMMDRGGDHSASDAELWAMPPIKLTPAAETKSIVRMNGLLLLGFGPRVADAIEDLSEAIYGKS
ncbi:heme/hemin ABC transporter substrate-binding protein [Planktotalea sp.]|uniref:heme/hemin ABC transporter substrate-binding protein n=1 Tax=Planktotalea sp. TaxID=2029877 RepID=UPI003F6A54AE